MTTGPSASRRSSTGAEASPNRQRRNAQSHVAILDATVALLAASGYHRLTIERVAARAGVGKATVYRWWPTKARLVVEALGSRLDLNPVEPTGDLKADVRALVRRAIEMFAESPLGRVLPEMVSDLAEDAEAREQLSTVVGPVRAGHLSLLYSAAGRADLPYDIDAHLIIDMIGGTVLYRALLGRRPSPQLAEQLADLIVDQRLPRVSAEDGQRA